MDPPFAAVRRNRDAGSRRNPVGGGSASSSGTDHSLGEGSGRGAQAPDDSAGGENAAALARGGVGGVYERREVDSDESAHACGGGGGRPSFCNVGSDDPSVPYAEWGEGSAGGYGGFSEKTADSSGGIFSVDSRRSRFRRCIDSCGRCEPSPEGGTKKGGG